MRGLWKAFPVVLLLLFVLSLWAGAAPASQPAQLAPAAGTISPASPSSRMLSGVEAGSPPAAGSLGLSAESAPAAVLADSRSVEAILVYGGADVHYSLYGHQPVEPNAGTPPQNWNWWSLTGAVSGTVAATPADNGRSYPDVAFSRQGSLMVFWEEYYQVDTIDCLADPGNPVQEPRYRGDIAFRRLQIDPLGGSAWGALGTIADGATDEMLTAPSIAFDNNGTGLAVWVHTKVVRGINNCFDHLEKRLEYRVWNGVSWGLLGTIPADGQFSATPCGHDYGYCDHVTDVAFTARLVDPAGSTTRQQAIAVWNEFIISSSRDCDGWLIRHDVLWPYYALWDGSGFAAPVMVPPGPLQGPTEYSHVMHKVSISGDQEGNAELAFLMARQTDLPAPTCIGFGTEVWTARWNNSGQSWADAALLSADSAEADVAFFQAGGVYPPNPDDKAIAVYGSGWATRAPGGNWVVRTPFAADLYGPAVAALAHDKVLSAWTDVDGIKWAEMDRASETWSTPAGLGPGNYFMKLAALTGSPTLPRAEWTFALYEAGDTRPGRDAAKRAQVEAVGSTALVNAVSLYDTQGDDTRYSYHILGGRFQRRNAGGVSVGNPAVLRDYLAWAAEHYPADRYLLEMDDHGLAWSGLCLDDRPARGDYLDLPELGTALADSGRRLDLLVLRACLMATVEVAYEVRDRAEFLVASEDWMDAPNGGIRNDHMLETLTVLPAQTSLALAGRIIQNYQSDNDNQTTLDHTLSAIDLSEVGSLGDAVPDDLIDTVSDLANAINTSFAGNEAAIRAAAGNAEAMQGDAAMRDLGSFSQNLSTTVGLPPALRSAAAAVLGAVDSAVVANWADDLHRVGHADGGALLVHGLTVWLQDQDRLYASGSAPYGLTAFERDLAAVGADNSWSRVVDNVAHSSGAYLLLTAGASDLFAWAALPSGESVGGIDPLGKECGGFCACQVADAICYKRGLSQEIWLPDMHPRFTWFVDGALVSGTVPFTLTIETVVASNVAWTQEVTGTIGPGEVISGTYVLYRIYLPLIFKGYVLSQESTPPPYRQVEPVDGAGQAGRYTSLGLDTAGQPHIGYPDATDGDLRYAWYGP